MLAHPTQIYYEKIAQATKLILSSYCSQQYGAVNTSDQNTCPLVAHTQNLPRTRTQILSKKVTICSPFLSPMALLLACYSFESCAKSMQVSTSVALLAICAVKCSSICMFKVSGSLSFIPFVITHIEFYATLLGIFVMYADSQPSHPQNINKMTILSSKAEKIEIPFSSFSYETHFRK